MEKINGYSREETERLIGFLSDGKKEGKTLSGLFEEYGKAHGRASGSVRNYYYQLLRSKDERARNILEGKDLKAEKIKEFTDEEAEKMLSLIFSERSKGLSVRKSIANICEGDEKLMLRYQNKYRNMLKKQPDQVKEAAERMGAAQCLNKDRKRANDFLQKRLEKEINELYDRLAVALREENERLKQTVEKLTEENETLRRVARKTSHADCG